MIQVRKLELEDCDSEHGEVVGCIANTLQGELLNAGIVTHMPKRFHRVFQRQDKRVLYWVQLRKGRSLSESVWERNRYGVMYCVARNIDCQVWVMTNEGERAGWRRAEGEA